VRIPHFRFGLTKVGETNCGFKLSSVKAVNPKSKSTILFSLTLYTTTEFKM
jgi:hypothetical protein